jgi:hypothetical protein
MKIKIGKLYENQVYFWLVLPTKQHSMLVRHTPTRYRPNAEADAMFYSKHCSCDVSYITPKTMFVVLEEHAGECFKILTEHGEVGWIYLGRKWYMSDSDIRRVKELTEEV